MIAWRFPCWRGPGAMEGAEHDGGDGRCQELFLLVTKVQQQGTIGRCFSVCSEGK
jgi:hypothetical protein